MYRIVMEDATRYLPHSPVGIEYLHYVYGPFGIAFSGTRTECEAWVARVEAVATTPPAA